MSDAGHAPEKDSLIGVTVADRYRVLSLLGRGGMGSVYVCEHVQLRKRMALKVLAEEYRRQPELIGRFLKEARAAAQIGHPNIVDVFDLGELPGGGAFIAMALLEGRDLATEVEAAGPMPFARARGIVGQICRALAAAHAKGIVHRDLKPANVFLSRSADGEEQVKILDFGIAQVSDVDGEAARLTQTGAIVGTPAFMSPEQARGVKIDHRTDIYSVGCILYNLITATVVFEGPTLMSVMTKHLFDPPQPPSVRAPPASVSPELDAVVLRALAKDPDQRYQTMKELWNALESLTDDPMAWPEVTSGRFASVGEIPAAVRTPTPIPTAEVLRAAPSSSSRWGLFGGLALAGVGLAVGTTMFLTHQSTPPTTVAPAPEVKEVPIEIHSSTPDAQVTIRGKQYSLPLKTQLLRNTQAEMVEVAAPGHVAKRMWVTFDSKVVLDANLEEEKTATPSPPEPVAAPATPHPAAHPAHVPPATKTTHAVAPAPTPTTAPTPAPTPTPTPTPAPPPVAVKPPEPAKPATTPPARPAAPQPIAATAMQRQTQAHRAQIESCIAEDPAATGRLVFRLIVGTSGRVESTQLIEAAHRFPPVERCLSKNLSTWVFSPAPSAPSEGRAAIDLD